jgi:hypothetical protein
VDDPATLWSIISCILWSELLSLVVRLQILLFYQDGFSKFGTPYNVIIIEIHVLAAAITGSLTENFQDFHIPSLQNS